MSRQPGTVSRRVVLGGAVAAPAASIPLTHDSASAAGLSQFDTVELRGAVDAAAEGLIANAIDDQSRALQTILDRASGSGKSVFLPAGIYNISNINLPERTHLTGVPGATRLVYSGNGHFLMSENASHLEMEGVTLDGHNRGLNEYAGAALRVTNAKHVVISNCRVVGSLEKGIQIDRSRGRIERCEVTGALGLCGIYAVENHGLAITGNEVSGCSNGGILVHRWQPGEDRTIVSGNRISDIRAVDGGTGQNGNGINVFRAGSVMITNNQISDCALSAIRSNSGDNVQIIGNQCLRSGETAIFSEFSFEGAVISNNVVDGGANGISIANFREGGRIAICSGNLVRNILSKIPYENEGQGGTGIFVEADSTVTGNVIENTANFGLKLGWGPYLRDVVASANVIRDTETGINVSVVEGARNTVISDNVISDVRKGAIVGYEWRKPVTGDMGSGDSFGYPHLAVERNRVG